MCLFVLAFVRSCQFKIISSIQLSRAVYGWHILHSYCPRWNQFVCNPFLEKFKIHIHALLLTEQLKLWEWCVLLYNADDVDYSNIVLIIIVHVGWVVCFRECVCVGVHLGPNDFFFLSCLLSHFHRIQKQLKWSGLDWKWLIAFYGCYCRCHWWGWWWCAYFNAAIAVALLFLLSFLDLCYRNKSP